MAESIHTIIKNGTFTVNHQGNDLVTEVSSFFGGIDKLTSLEEIKEWLAGKTPDEQLAFYHYGFDSSIIKNRAWCRPKVKTYAKKDDFDSAVDKLDDPENYHISISKQTITMNIFSDPKAEARSIGWTPKPKMVPGSSAPKAFGKGEESALKMSIEALQEAAMTDETILDILSAKFDRAKVQVVLDGLKG